MNNSSILKKLLLTALVASHSGSAFFAMQPAPKKAKIETPGMPQDLYDGATIPAKTNPFQYLPKDVTQHILSFVPIQDLLSSCTKVDHMFKDVTLELLLASNNSNSTYKDLNLNNKFEDFKSGKLFLHNISNCGISILGNSDQLIQTVDTLTQMVDMYFILRQIKTTNQDLFNSHFESQFKFIHQSLLSWINKIYNLYYTDKIYIDHKMFLNLVTVLNRCVKMNSLNSIKFLFGCMPPNGKKYLKAIATSDFKITDKYDYRNGSPFLETLKIYTSEHFELVQTYMHELWELLESRPVIKQYLESRGVQTTPKQPYSCSIV